MNGLARKLIDTDFLDIIRSYDIIILQETWLSSYSHFNLNIQGYESEHLFGNKSVNTRKGRYSGGISIYFKSKLKGKIQIVEKEQCGIMWIKLCKTLFTFDSDVYICSSYIKPRDSRVLLAEDIDMFEQIESGVEKYKMLGKVFITGDLNSRTSNEPDFLIFDNYLDNNVELELNNNIMQRVSKDKILDDHGKRLLQLCKSTNLLIGNGRLCKDTCDGEYTFINSNGCSVVDYLLLSHNDFNIITQFEIQPLNEFSDHCAIFFTIERKNTMTESRDSTTTNEQYIAWDESRAEAFRQLLLDNNDTLLQLTTNLNDNSINQSIEAFTTYIQKHALSIFGREKKSFSTRNAKNKWFDKKCYEAKRKFSKCRNVFLRHKNNDNKASFLKSKNEYNKIKRKTKNNLNGLKEHELRTLQNLIQKLSGKMSKHNTKIL